MDVDERAGHGAAEAAEGVRGEGGPGSRGVYGVWVGRDDGRLMTLYWGVLRPLLPELVYPMCGRRFQGWSLLRALCVLFRARAVIKRHCALHRSWMILEHVFLARPFTKYICWA